jgi:hypothetical protein
MTPRIGMLSKTIALVPLAALSVVCTVSAVRTTPAEVSAVAGSSAASPAAPSAPPVTVPDLPDPPLVVPPASPAPASVGDGAEPPPGIAAVAATTMPAIPPVALAAYQRAATVIDTADPSCGLDWTLLAAIGRVESDHGNHGDSALSADGHETPAVVGLALTGLAGTLLVTDTDAGVLDGDTRFDHAVGPMQFLPSTWSVVGVDADGDGQRDPQDIDDAALAAGVYLCSGSEDLTTPAGRQAALLRYNHSASYVATVLRIAAEYQSGTGLGVGLGGLVATRALTIVPAVVIEPKDQPSTGPGQATDHKRRHRHQHQAALVGPTTQPSQPATGQPDPGPGGQPPATDQPTEQPSDEPSDQPTGQPTDEPTTDPTPGGGTDPGTPLPATAEQLADLCADRVATAYPHATDEAVAEAVPACVDGLTAHSEPTLDEAEKLVGGVVTALAAGIEGLEPESTPEPAPADPTPTPTGSAQPTAAADPRTTDSSPAGQ